MSDLDFADLEAIAAEHGGFVAMMPQADGLMEAVVTRLRVDDDDVISLAFDRYDATGYLRHSRL